MTMPTEAGAFDLHQHVGVLVGIPGAQGGQGGKAPLDDDLRLRLEFLDRFGIAAAALMPGHSYASPRGAADTRALNDVLAAYQARAPERFPFIFGTVEPRHGAEEAVAEVERLHGLGFRGLSWHHRMHGLPLDHPVMFAVLERMDEFGMIAMAHCYANGDFESAWRLRRLAERFPKTTFMALDAMVSPENLEQIIAAAEVAQNIHVDLTTSVLGVPGIRTCIERLGPERLVFGSNYYSMGSPTRVPELDDLAAAQLPPQVLALIGGGNARRLLGGG